MGTDADLSEFDTGQIVMARRLGTSITETAGLVGCSRSAVVIIHAKGISDGDTSSRRHSVGRHTRHERKRTSETVPLGKANSAPDSGSADSPIQCRFKRKCFGTHSSGYTVGYGTVQQTPHSCASVDQAPSSITPTVGLGASRLDHGEWKRVAWWDESRFLIHHVDGRVRVRRLPGEQLLPSCTAGHTQAAGGGIMLWGTLSWAALGPVVVVEQTMKAANNLNIIADQLHPYMAFVFPTGNGIFQKDNAPLHKARIVLEWFEEHTDELYLMSWPPNSPDLNPMEHIWDVMERSSNTTMSEYLNFA
ncbi:Transposable element Tc1 transposase [Araneus ventricosus]|uniref:Transposable element Tc1 transposase n=1 Tax=Araneus ventricosus TaxID=182803 RepID=A0A4Y2KIC1_ARAVE|nr:Transposable element Tc1 transposase [Araneus ventricosus]